MVHCIPIEAKKGPALGRALFYTFRGIKPQVTSRYFPLRINEAGGVSIRMSRP